MSMHYSQTMKEQKEGSTAIPTNIEAFMEGEINKFAVIQEYLQEECKRLKFTELAININAFDQTIETMHDQILAMIETADK